MFEGKIAILGTGANGGAIGADLTRAGLDVTMIDQWPANVEAMQRLTPKSKQFTYATLPSFM